MKVVGIGGGHGLAATLRAARRYADDIAAVVTVADDGGSSGRLTREMGIPPPGDIRNCLVALAGDDDLARLFQFRFEHGPLTGHALGNLVIAALSEQLGDFARAVARAGELLGARGRVFPATTELVELAARTPGGEVEGQVAVAQTSAPIERVYLSPADPVAHGPAVDAILAADQIVLGPGSLFTSLIATLLVPGISDAVRSAPGYRVFVGNNRQQKGETEGMSAAEHLAALMRHVGRAVDAMVIQEPVGPDGVAIDAAEIAEMGVRVVTADVTAADGTHDPERLAGALSTLVR
ncbi:MAG TPA: gluconeogenesis factor YvcK family protein [Actinomycetota bacterium]|nr:gluconeogenesis factor YvcK family protein [Actinomycetota bacterium]